MNTFDIIRIYALNELRYYNNDCERIIPSNHNKIQILIGFFMKKSTDILID